MSLVQFLVLLLNCVCLELCTAIDTISFNQSIQDSESIVSNGETFKLGFFSPVNTTNRYVGIWFNGVSAMAVVWVANRDKPLNDSSGRLKMTEDGNLVVLDGKERIIWSSNLSSPGANSSAQLLDTGNLVLRDNSDGSRTTWESFQHPSDSLLPKMRVGNDVNTNAKILLTSWKSPSDPSMGRFSAGVDPLKSFPEIFIWNDSRPHWRSGPWNGQILVGVPFMESLYLNGFSLEDDKQGRVYLSFTNTNVSRLTYFVLSSQGTLMQMYWDDGTENWESNWSGQMSGCDVYGKCGPFGSCNSKESPICTCLRGFVPKNIEEWSSGYWTSGCVRRTPLQCEKNNTTGGEEGKEDGFLKLKSMKVPDFAVWSSALEEDCESECLKNCSCVAYAFYTGIGCMLWSGNLIDIQKLSSIRPDLHIRVAYSELEKKRNMNLVIATSVIIGSLTIGICTYFSRSWIAKRRDSESGMKKRSKLLLFDREVSNCSDEIILGDVLNQVKLEELPVFKFDQIAIATDNFSSGSKLGQGGFGPVYKGILPQEGEIAVKRLSKSSGQGHKEFMNEVLLISKLQHRNLVRLLGCCVEGEEKMLIYEYMPNKSLDAFLFDPVKQKLLDWNKRFSIIEGIGRGLLYLHRDSRLKIIHRDLKASNILLDEELNPKISDFGMARIFGGNQDQDNTKRIVGTYGYMAPEYAMEGRFSEKSDVFSFGVLLLEIISGRRNTSFYHDEDSLSLLGFAWKLWDEDNTLALIDPTISDPFFQTKMLGCIHVGLLCVQELAKDRPSISSALSMLTSEIADLPIPKQPAFTERHVSVNAEPLLQQSQERCSINRVTITVIGGR